MKTKKEQLDLVLEEQYMTYSEPEYKFKASFIPTKGWYAIPDRHRWFDDKGEFLGKTFDHAIKSAKNIYGVHY